MRGASVMCPQDLHDVGPSRSLGKGDAAMIAHEFLSYSPTPPLDNNRMSLCAAWHPRVCPLVMFLTEKRDPEMFYVGGSEETQ